MRSPTSERRRGVVHRTVPVLLTIGGAIRATGETTASQTASLVGLADTCEYLPARLLRQRLIEARLVVLRQLLEGGPILGALVGLAERAPCLAELGINGDRL